MRSPFLFACLLLGLIGFAVNISDAPNGAKYFGTFFCIAGLYAAFPGTVAWYATFSIVQADVEVPDVIPQDRK